MPARRPPRRLQLGPIVGHTDEGSARIWIQVRALDDPAQYALRVEGVGLFPFVSTEFGTVEFGTVIATAVGLQADIRYRYRVARRGRFVAGASGTFRTLPPPGSMTNLLFCAVSCNLAKTDGAWVQFGEFVERAQPSFLLMMGDQVYLDEDPPDTFNEHVDSDPATRRKAIAEKYRANWSRPVVAKVLANVPTYMVWDDHDIRDGWGSLAGDSPTLLALHPRGRKIFQKTNAYFEDTRDVYWHFQGCHNPQPGDYRDPALPGVADPAFPNYIGAPPLHGQRLGMPFVFRCGRLIVLVLDSRGERDVFREQYPILGARQWQFIDEVLARLPADVDALAVVTPTPIASQDPDGQTQRLFGTRSDDVEAFKRGDEEELFHPKSTKDFDQFLLAAAGARLSRATGTQFNLGNFKVSAIDEARDQWCHRFARPEQADLLRKAAAARLVNRSPGSPRELFFLSGDIHIGCVFEISLSRPSYKALSLTTSGIGVVDDTQPLIGVFVDQEFSVAKGIRATLDHVVNQFNFGVLQVQPTGRGAKVFGTVAHEGNSFAAGIDLKDIL
jgi:hypothetical protein